MKLKQYVYEIFKTNEANNGTDILNMGLPMFLNDVERGRGCYCPEPLDFAVLKEQWEAMTSEERAQENQMVRRFITEHYSELVKAYPDRDKMTLVGVE